MFRLLRQALPEAAWAPSFPSQPLTHLHPTPVTLSLSLLWLLQGHHPDHRHRCPCSVTVWRHLPLASPILLPRTATLGPVLLRFLGTSCHLWHPVCGLTGLRSGTMQVACLSSAPSLLYLGVQGAQ